MKLLAQKMHKPNDLKNCNNEICSNEIRLRQGSPVQQINFEQECTS